jgi:c(7)-type cytochrome triheme protein
MSRALVFVALLIIIAVAAGILLTRSNILAAPEQPIDFSHQTHVDFGVQCLFCHSGAMRSPVAGIPSVQKCMGCHNVIATDSPIIQEVAGYWERGEPIPWNKVNTQPDFVIFSHEAHVSAGFNCEQCHGTVAEMGVARPVVKMDMGWCLDCHLDQPEQRAAILADCLVCHK